MKQILYYMFLYSDTVYLQHINEDYTIVRRLFYDEPYSYKKFYQIFFVGA